MIQRIQSIWFLLASLTVCCLLFMPMATTTVGNIAYQIIANGLYEKTGNQTKQIESYLPLLISTIVVALVCFFNIFNFRKRLLQKRIGMVAVILIIGLSFWCSQYAQKIPGGLATANYHIGMFLPVIAIVFCILAIRGINHDEKLIKSADRLR